ncbi:MAG: Holliday junction branch migration protein RuvA [Gammaproteobacteria bacterium]
MIGQLKGVLIKKQAPHLLLDVNGVGYEVEAPMTTIYNLPEVGNEVMLHTHLIVRDDAHLLFGFGSEAERSMFRSLIKVNGVGAKMALAILSGIEADEFYHCVRDGNTDRLVKLPGVGKKTAERLIVEMRDRLQDWQSGDAPATGRAPAGKPSNPTDEAVSALIALGYKPQEASRLVLAVAQDDMDSESLIREALKASVK